MADRIVGLPSNLTVVTAGTGGNVRVTYQPWELDWEFFDLLAVDGTHYLANTTTVASAAINNKGGAEHLGYWIEIAVVFPSANWNTGNRITPQRQAAITSYATFAAAFAAMANNDVLLVWYQNTANKRSWQEGPANAGKGGGVWGMLSRRQLLISAVSYTGALVGMNVQAPVRNLFLRAGLTYTGNVGSEGAGADISRVTTFVGTGNGSFWISRALANTVIIRNCLTIGGSRSIWFQNATGLAYNCTAVYGFYGFVLLASVCRNLVASECTTGCFNGAANCQNCADTDGTLPVHATNLRNQSYRTQLRFLHGLVRPGNNAFPCDDGRVFHDTVLAGAGVAGVGIPTVDMDNYARPAPPSIGAFEPREVAYAPAAEIIRGASKRGVQT